MYLKSSNDKFSPVKQPLNLTNFLVRYFDCCYILCCSPYRFVKNKDGLFKRTKFFPHFILSAVLSIFALIKISTNLRRTYINSSLQDNASPLKYFELLSDLFTKAFQVLTLKNFWFQSNRKLNIINFIQSECFHLSPTNLQQKVIPTFLKFLKNQFIN